jgi:hypothetical protein
LAIALVMLGVTPKLRYTAASRSAARPVVVSGSTKGRVFMGSFRDGADMF